VDLLVLTIDSFSGL